MVCIDVLRILVFSAETGQNLLVGKVKKPTLPEKRAKETRPDPTHCLACCLPYPAAINP